MFFFLSNVVPARKKRKKGTREGEQEARDSLCSSRCGVGAIENENTHTQTGRSTRHPSLYVCAGPATREAKSQNQRTFTHSPSEDNTTPNTSHPTQIKLSRKTRRAGETPGLFYPRTNKCDTQHTASNPSSVSCPTNPSLPPLNSLNVRWGNKVPAVLLDAEGGYFKPVS